MHGFIPGLSILFHLSIFLFFVPVPYSFDCCSFVVYSEVRKPPDPFFFLKIALAIWGLLCFHMNYEVFCCSSVKYAIGYLMRIALNL